MDSPGKEKILPVYGKNARNGWESQEENLFLGP
jgi:hypothetical protein